MKVYFDNCPSCPNGVLELPTDRLDDAVTACQERWGNGQLVRMNGEYIWVKRTDQHGSDWKGCCAEKINGKQNH